MRTQHSISTACTLAVLMGWSALTSADSEGERSFVSPPVAAVAVLHPSADHPVAGKVHFRTTGDSLVIQLELGGLSPERRYRLQLHEYGDCSAGKAANTGEPLADAPADLIEFSADDDGWVEITFSHRGDAPELDLASLLGRAVVVHGMSEPVGCGTIGVARRLEALPRIPADRG